MVERTMSEIAIKLVQLLMSNRNYVCVMKESEKYLKSRPTASIVISMDETIRTVIYLPSYN